MPSAIRKSQPTREQARQQRREQMELQHSHSRDDFGRVLTIFASRASVRNVSGTFMLPTG